MGNDVENRFARGVRLSYLYTLLPEEMSRDPIVCNVASTWVMREDFSVEKCLVDMVRQLTAAKQRIQGEYADYMRRHPRLVVKEARRG
jgi:hypothetical protein